MNRSRDYLNEKQIAVLEWVRAGCPEGVFGPGFAHRIVARALEARGLVRISGQGATWKADATGAGKEWQSPIPEIPSAQASDILMERVIEAGGRLQLERGELTPELDAEVKRSLESPARPRGQKLKLHSEGSWSKRIDFVVLVPHFHDLVEVTPVPIVQRLTKPHPVVAAYLKDTDWTFVTKDHVPRAARLLQSVVEEALRRGIDVSPPAPLEGRTARGGRWPHPASPVFVLRYNERVFSVTVQELGAQGGGRLPYSHDHLKHPLWLNQRHWRFVSTGRLAIGCAGGYKDERWTKVEDKLPELFRDLAVRDLELTHSEAQRAQAEVVREKQWALAMIRAKEQYEAESRYARIRDMSDSWDLLNRRRAFLEAAREGLDSYPSEERVEIEAQLDLAEKQVDKLDPLHRLSDLIAEVSEPSSEDLKPYLGSWSPRGPNAQW